MCGTPASIWSNLRWTCSDWTKSHQVSSTSLFKSNPLQAKASTICHLSRKRHAIQNRRHGYLAIWGNPKIKTTKASRRTGIVTLCTWRRSWRSLGLVGFPWLSIRRTTRDQMPMEQQMQTGIARTITRSWVSTRFRGKRTISTSTKEASAAQKPLSLT